MFPAGKRRISAGKASIEAKKARKTLNQFSGDSYKSGIDGRHAGGPAQLVNFAMERSDWRGRFFLASECRRRIRHEVGDFGDDQALSLAHRDDAHIVARDGENATGSAERPPPEAARSLWFRRRGRSPWRRLTGMMDVLPA